MKTNSLETSIMLGKVKRKRRSTSSKVDGLSYGGSLEDLEDQIRH